MGLMCLQESDVCASVIEFFNICVYQLNFFGLYLDVSVTCWVLVMGWSR